MPLPILYSFRRCPYAMRARVALLYAGCRVELREVSLKSKPAEMLARSAKGTVPVLITSAGTVLEESLEIMHWALANNDPDNWLLSNVPAGYEQAIELIQENDQVFKKHLDRYKYAVRHPEHSLEHYRAQGEEFLARLEGRLTAQPYLLGQQLSLADIAIAPFIRQFSQVDCAWFEQSPYPQLRRWLDEFLQSALFTSAMRKYPLWQPGEASTFL